MISARRLAREWALKILYQVDVGKCSLLDASSSALERLRREFVLGGSRSGTGSQVEEICIELITTEISRLLPISDKSLERALALAAPIVCSEMTYWQEVRFEMSFKSKFGKHPLSTPRITTPFPDSEFLPWEEQPNNKLSFHLAQLNSYNRLIYKELTENLREKLPAALSDEFKQTGLEFARNLDVNRPELASEQEIQSYLEPRRAQFVEAQAARWKEVGVVAGKQTTDWLKTTSFTSVLTTGVIDHQIEIDSTLEQLASGWKIDRQVSVDRNILRLAAFEMLYLPDIPIAATINEAVELAKKYSTDDSGRFVNGVLGALAGLIGDKPKSSTVFPISEENETEELIDIPEIDLMEEV